MKLIEDYSNQLFTQFKDKKFSEEDLAANTWYWLHNQINSQAQAADDPENAKHQDMLVYCTLFISHLECLRKILKERGEI